MSFKAFVVALYIGALATTVYSTTRQCHQIHIAVIPVEGSIESPEDLIDLLEKISEDPKYSAVLLLISSEGGSSSAAFFIADAINFCKTHKPVVAYVSETCTSGAYMIAIATDYIIASPTAFIGSIGVVSTFTKETQVNYTLDGSQFRLEQHEITTKPESRSSDGIEGDVYDHFRDEVIQSRPDVDRINPDQWSDGKIVTGRRALALKLIDEVGSYSEALEAIQRLLEKDNVLKKQSKLTKLSLTYLQV